MSIHTGIPTLNQISAAQTLAELRKVIVEDTVPDLKDTLFRDCDPHKQTRWQSNGKITPPVSNRYRNHDFTFGAVRLWNSAPQELRDAKDNPKLFKSICKMFVKTLP